MRLPFNVPETLVELRLSVYLKFSCLKFEKEFINSRSAIGVDELCVLQIVIPFSSRFEKPVSLASPS